VIEPLDLAGLFVVRGTRHVDARGAFTEAWRASELAAAGFDRPFVQENLVLTRAAGVLRGLHFQREPFAQDKLVQAAAGRIFDVAVDLRPGSPTLGRWAGVTLDASEPRQLLVPRGFAHGYLTLVAGCAVSYKVSAYHAPQAEAGLRWDDPALGIEWPLAAGQVSTNERDAAWPPLAQVIGQLRAPG